MPRGPVPASQASLRVRHTPAREGFWQKDEPASLQASGAKLLFPGAWEQSDTTGGYQISPRENVQAGQLIWLLQGKLGRGDGWSRCRGI